MNKFDSIQVIEFKSGKDVETWESEEDLRIGTTGRELLGKTQISWEDTKTSEWVPNHQITRFDRTTRILDRSLQKVTKAPETDQS